MQRCSWPSTELDILEGAQAGLSWSTILNKRFVDGRPLRNARKRKDIPARTAESDALSKDLKRRGFRFVGTTICYAFMQAVGMANDHLTTCYRHRQIARKSPMVE